MRIVVELTDATESTARNLEVLLFEELAAHLAKRNFDLEVLRIVEEDPLKATKDIEAVDAITHLIHGPSIKKGSNPEALPVESIS